MAAPTIDRALFTPALVQQVQGVLDKAQQTGERVSALEEVNDLLLTAKVAWRTRMACTP